MDITSASEQKLDYLTLLVTELQNQNPLDPMEQKDMAAQLAQFSQLELTEEMNGNIGVMNDTMSSLNESFRGQLVMAELEYAKSYLGKQVSFYSESNGEEVIGEIKKISIDDNFHATLVADFYSESNQQMETVELRQDQITGIVLN
jgi:flagellar basal-body rod modification protein FlgD